MRISRSHRKSPGCRLSTTCVVTALVLIISRCVCGAADWRNYLNGQAIVGTGNGYQYADQPYTAVFPDGNIVVLTTVGPSSEGNIGQHIIAQRSANGGATWSAPVDIEPASTNYLASWAIPFVSPVNNRLYAIYLYGDSTNGTQANGDLETHGYFAIKYSDDEGMTWSSNRTLISLPNAAIDNSNDYGGSIQLLWSVCKPVAMGTNVLFSFTKLQHHLVGSVNYDEMFLLRGYGMEQGLDPTNCTWTILPNATNGFHSWDSHFDGLQEEQNFQLMANGGLYTSFRGELGYCGKVISYDDGLTWTNDGAVPIGAYGLPLKQPRANTRVFSLGNGQYLLWNEFNGTTGVNNRNPAWVCPGFETASNITWGAPEILLYGINQSVRLSYPDMYQVGTNWFLTETDKQTARVHKIDPSFLNEIFLPVLARGFDSRGLIFTNGAPDASGNIGVVPPLGSLTSPTNQGFTIEMVLTVTNLSPNQVLLQNLNAAGHGFSVSTAPNGALSFYMSDGTTSFGWTTEQQTVRLGISDHVTIHVDSQAKILSVTSDGRVQDGGAQSQFGWSFLPSNLADISSSAPLWQNAAALGAAPLVRVYNRPLLNCQAIGNYFALGWTPARAVISYNSTNVLVGQSNLLSASSSDVSQLSTPVFAWQTDEGATGTGVTYSASFSTSGLHCVWLSIQDANNPLPSNGGAMDAVIFNVTVPQNHGTTVLPTNAVVAGRWSCDFTTSNTYGGSPATWVGQSGYSSACLEGTGCAVLNGASYLSLGSFGTSDRFTIAAYVNPAASIASSSFQDLVGNMVWGTGSVRLDFQSGHLVLTINLGGSLRTIINSGQITPNQWIHVAVTGNRSTGLACMYTNGVLAGTGSLAGLTQSFNFNTMACGWEQDNRYLTGLVDDILIAESEFTSNQVATLAGLILPVLAPIPDQTVAAGATLTFTNTATGPGGDQLIFSLNSGAPTNAFINAMNGVFGWMPTPDQIGNYPFAVIVTVAGQPQLCATQTFNVTVLTNTSPVVPNICLAWNYPTNLLSTNLTFVIYHSTNMALPVAQWPVFTNIVGTNLSIVTAMNSGQDFFIITAQDSTDGSNYSAQVSSSFLFQATLSVGSGN